MEMSKRYWNKFNYYYQGTKEMILFQPECINLDTLRNLILYNFNFGLNTALALVRYLKTSLEKKVFEYGAGVFVSLFTIPSCLNLFHVLQC